MLNFLKKHYWSIDVGSSRTRICCDGSIVLDEPSVVLTDKDGYFVSAGEDAARAEDRISYAIESPIRSGLIAEFYLAEEMLQYLLGKCGSRKISTLYCAYSNACTESLEFEKRAWKEMLETRICRRAIIVNSGLAAMTQLDLHHEDNECNIIVDIGSDTTGCTIVDKGKVISPEQILRVGGEDFDAATAIAVRKGGEVIIGYNSAKKAKESFGVDEVCKDIWCRYTYGSPVKIDIPYSMIKPYYDEIIGKIISYIEEQVTESKIEISSVKTIYLIGGASQTKGLREAVEQHKGIKTMIAPNP